MDAGIPDMKEIEYHHCPSLAYREDLASPIAAIAVGWLGSEVPTRGEVPGELRDALGHACSTRGTDFGELGSHVCQVCEAHEDRAEFIIEVEKITRTWKANKAENPQDAVGKKAVCQLWPKGRLYQKQLQTLAELKAGDRVVVEPFHLEPEHDLLTVVEALHKAD